MFTENCNPSNNVLAADALIEIVELELVDTVDLDAGTFVMGLCIDELLGKIDLVGVETVG